MLLTHLVSPKPRADAKPYLFLMDTECFLNVEFATADEVFFNIYLVVFGAECLEYEACVLLCFDIIFGRLLT
jgi:hypothetical protein